MLHLIVDTSKGFASAVHSGPLRITSYLLVGGFSLSFLYYILIRPLYNVFLHPLRHIPGPKLWAATPLFYSRSIFGGLVHQDLRELHGIYGPVVRVGPDIVNICHPEGQRDVKGHRKIGLDENSKDPVTYSDLTLNLLGAPREEHTAQRRVLSHAFSTQAMMEQQPIIRGYVDKLIEGLRRTSKDGTQLVEMTSWLNWLTFDVIGDLAFGEPFRCLENSSYHAWVDLTLFSLKYTRFQTVLKRLGGVAALFQRPLIRKLSDAFLTNRELSALRVRKRLAAATSRPDFIEMMVAGGRKGEHPLSFEKMVANAELLVIAGSETTASLLSGLLYFLTTNTHALAKLNGEVRSVYKDDAEVDLVNTQHLTYLNAVVNEALRIYAPVAGSGPRIAAAGGITVAGHYIPQGTVLDTDIWTIHHDPSMFTLPDSYIPERWLGDVRFKNDRLDAVEPFSTGPRNCLGKNLAYAEIRMVLARLVLNFDMEINSEDKNWIVNQKAFFVWEKPPLRLWLKPVSPLAQD